MSAPNDPNSRVPRAQTQAVFATTRWSIILDAGNEGSERHSDALLQLCQTYWYPLYAFARHQGRTPHDAQDLTQGFFAQLLERNFLDRADRTKGRFRWFLLGSFKKHISHERERDRAIKRGGDRTHISLDEVMAEKIYQLEPRTDVSPDHIFERTWAATVLSTAKAQVRKVYEQRGKLDRFEQLQSLLPGDYEKRPHAEIARELGISESALRVELHRLRATYREILRAEIAQTVSMPAEIDDELRHLISVVQG